MINRRMERSSQLILRNEPRLQPGAVLLVNPPRDTLFRRLQQNGRRVRVSTQDHGDFHWLAGSGTAASFEAIPAPMEDSETVILHLPREKDRLSMLLHGLSSWLPDTARLWLVGENQAGIKSSGRRLAEYFGTVNRLDNARHCGLYEASHPVRGNPFELKAYEETWPAGYSHSQIEVVSLPGVFAHGRLDPGSRLLLSVLERLEPAGKVLDFACGSGVLGCSVMAAGSGVDLTLLDVSALAVESCRRTLARNTLEATLLPSDGLSELDGQYDWIISNPPFHRGVGNDLDIAARFFAEAGTFLGNRGKIVIVCNRHLPYLDWLRSHFEQVECLDENNSFLIMQASHPRE